MILSGTAERTVRRVIRWERRAFGIRAWLSPRLRERMRRVIGVGPLQEGRRYAAPERVHQLFETLDRQNARYVVLRWFEGLPDAVDGDIDFLVADEDLPLFESLLVSRRGGVPCDLYSGTGVPGYRYAGMGYFPAALSQKILSRRVRIPGPLSVPCPEDHFLSLAYHAVYQKGLRSGLPTSLDVTPAALPPMHDYRGTLTRLAEELGLRVEVSMEALDDMLASMGWRPAPPVLQRLAQHNPWLRERLRVARLPKSQPTAPVMQVAS